MLSKNKKLNRKDLEVFFEKNTKKFRSPSFLFLYEIEPKKESRFAAVASKGQFRRAVDRNKAKRSLYSAISKTPDNLTRGIRGAFVLRRSFLENDKQTILREVGDVLRKIKNQESK